jgi:hypothetical protein
MEFLVLSTVVPDAGFSATFAATFAKAPSAMSGAWVSEAILSLCKGGGRSMTCHVATSGRPPPALALAKIRGWRVHKSTAD